MAKAKKKYRTGTFARVNADFVNMPCVDRLAKVLNVNRFEATTYIALLVAFGIQHGKLDGCINDFTPRTIENACLWPRERRYELIVAFQDAEILTGLPGDDDEPLFIASELWSAQAQDIADRRKADRERKSDTDS